MTHYTTLKIGYSQKFIHVSPDDSPDSRSSASASFIEILDRFEGLEENVTSLQIRLVSKCEMRV